MSVRLIAWIALLSIIAIVFITCYSLSLSSLSFFRKDVASIARNVEEPRLRALVVDALEFVDKIINFVFISLLLALAVSLLVLLIEDLTISSSR